jgi:hypothetical protein
VMHAQAAIKKVLLPRLRPIQAAVKALPPRLRPIRAYGTDLARDPPPLQRRGPSVKGVAITPDGCRVVSASEDTTLRVLDLDKTNVKPGRNRFFSAAKVDAPAWPAAANLSCPEGRACSDPVIGSGFASFRGARFTHCQKFGTG